MFIFLDPDLKIVGKKKLSQDKYLKLSKDSIERQKEASLWCWE